MKLTQEEIDALMAWMNESAVGNMEVERPVVVSPTRLDNDGVGVVLGGKTGLSTTSRRAAENKIAKKKKREEAVKARAAKVKRGRYHPKKKKATRDRAALKRWTEQPYKSLVYGYGVWAISQEEWDQKLGGYWLQYNPRDLTVKRRWGYGTKDKPYTIYDVNLLHKGSVIYNGQDQLIYDSSVPNDLDIKKAPEGAELFTDRWWLSGDKLRLLRHLERNGLKLELLYRT